MQTDSRFSQTIYYCILRSKPEHKCVCRLNRCLILIMSISLRLVHFLSRTRVYFWVYYATSGTQCTLHWPVVEFYVQYLNRPMLLAHGGSAFHSIIPSLHCLVYQVDPASILLCSLPYTSLMTFYSHLTPTLPCPDLGSNYDQLLIFHWAHTQTRYSSSTITDNRKPVFTACALRHMSNIIVVVEVGA